MDGSLGHFLGPRRWLVFPSFLKDGCGAGAESQLLSVVRGKALSVVRSTNRRYAEQGGILYMVCHGVEAFIYICERVPEKDCCFLSRLAELCNLHS